MRFLVGDGVWVVLGLWEERLRLRCEVRRERVASPGAKRDGCASVVLEPVTPLLVGSSYVYCWRLRRKS